MTADTSRFRDLAALVRVEIHGNGRLLAQQARISLKWYFKLMSQLYYALSIAPYSNLLSCDLIHFGLLHIQNRIIYCKLRNFSSYIISHSQ
jgi:hypothetical protein